MAQKPDGKAVRTERVTFTKPAAERIAKVVRTVEQGDRGGAALTFGGMPAGMPAAIKICTFTGSLAIGTPKTVTFKYATNTPNTVTAQNLFWEVPQTQTTTDCAIGKHGTAWYLLSIPVESRTAVFVTQTTAGTSVGQVSLLQVMTDISISGSLNTSNCAITISKTPTTAWVSLVEKTGTAVFVTSTITGTFLRVRVP
jgi:hypothetical protein